MTFKVVIVFENNIKRVVEENILGLDKAKEIREKERKKSNYNGFVDFKVVKEK